MSETRTPVCWLCQVNEPTYDSEPPNPGYLSQCYRCFCLAGDDPQGQGRHEHDDDTASRLVPTFDDGRLTGWRCVGLYKGEACEYVQPLAARYVARPNRLSRETRWHVVDLQTALPVNPPDGGELTEQGARDLAAVLNTPQMISPEEMMRRLKAGEPVTVMVPDFADPCGMAKIARPVTAVFAVDAPKEDGTYTVGRHQIFFGGAYLYPASLATYPPDLYEVVPDVR
jgi:hypothetical protein